MVKYWPFGKGYWTFTLIGCQRPKYIAELEKTNNKWANDVNTQNVALRCWALPDVPNLLNTYNVGKTLVVHLHHCVHLHRVLKHSPKAKVE